MKSLITLSILLTMPLANAAQIKNIETPKASYAATDSELVVKDGLTVWDLKELVDSGQAKLVDELFEKWGVTVDCVPSGYSAGAASKVLKSETNELTSLVMTALTGKLWHGKYFARTERTCQESHGLNRINRVVGLIGGESINFVTRSLVAPVKLAGSRAMAVELNYSDAGNDIPSRAVKALGVYDLMVAIPGKYGPVYIGKTWFGKYKNGAAPGSFDTNTPDELVAYFFLDFNQGALDEQKIRDSSAPNMNQTF